MIVDIEIRNQKYNKDGSTIDCELNHPIFGWIPFTASGVDVAPHGQAIYKAIIEGQFGPIAEAE